MSDILSLWAIFKGNVDLLVKLGEEKYIDDMYKNEYLFFNSFSSFRQSEKDPYGRNDPREANTKNKQVRYLEIITDTGAAIKLSEISINFNSQFHESPSEVPHNICSLYTLHFNEEFKSPEIDDRILRLGNRALIIYDLDQFFDTLDNALEMQGLAFSRRSVRYYDHKTYDGNLTFHDKDSEFSYQNEYRILIKTSGKEKLSIHLPGLSTISAVIDTKLLATIEVKPF